MTKSPKKCYDIYKEDSKHNEWLVDDLEHVEIGDVDDGIVIQRCAFCGGKIYPKDQYA